MLQVGSEGHEFQNIDTEYKTILNVRILVDSGIFVLGLLLRKKYQIRER